MLVIDNGAWEAAGYSQDCSHWHESSLKRQAIASIARGKLLFERCTKMLSGVSKKPMF